MFALFLACIAGPWAWFNFSWLKVERSTLNVKTTVPIVPPVQPDRSASATGPLPSLAHPLGEGRDEGPFAFP
ncbi:MAG: hypothetical protein KGS61_18385, partial [Verrucomicrobia bacterium]|nr:hypothetical protein [Verrucomicrobiota bacterium]